MKQFFAIFFIIGLFAKCTFSERNANILRSENYKNQAEGVEILKKEIKSFSDFQDAEFILFNVNGFLNQRVLLPGASSWDYKFAIKINTADISKWTDGLQSADLPNYDIRWTKEIFAHRKQNWQTQSKPKYYTRAGEDVTVLVFEDEGIIFKRVINL